MTIFVLLYGGKGSDSLSSLRYAKYMTIFVLLYGGKGSDSLSSLRYAKYMTIFVLLYGGKGSDSLSSLRYAKYMTIFVLLYGGKGSDSLSSLRYAKYMTIFVLLYGGKGSDSLSSLRYAKYMTIFVLLYGGKDSDSLSSLRYAKYMKIFVLLYGGKDSDSLSSLRYAKYMKMTSITSSIKPEKLPPTERAAYFHSLRVYHQVQEWNSLREDSSNATNWGWKLQDGILIPVMTDEAPAPDEILNVVRCNCQVASKNPCGGSRCSCRNNELHCVAACGDCRGTECENCNKCETLIADTDQVENLDDDSYDNLFDNLFFV